MNMRHEWKHELNNSDMYVLRSRLKAVCLPDPHGIDGKYQIRSLYFDNLQDKALREKVNGVNRREKFRIRFYNGDTSFICLERKIKIGNMTGKQECRLAEWEARRLAEKDYSWMEYAGKQEGRELITMLYSKIRGEGLQPTTIVDYTREPFIFAPGNVRVTLDYNIRTGLRSTDFLNPNCVTIPTPYSPIILEVKWDDYLPDIIRDLVQLPGRRTGAFSKYEACRMYG